MKTKINSDKKTMNLADLRPCIRTSTSFEDLKKNLDENIREKVDWGLIESDGISLREAKEAVAWIWDRWEERRIQKNESARRRRRGISNPYNSGVKRFAIHPYVKRYSISQRREDSSNSERDSNRPIRKIIKNPSLDDTMERIQALEDRLSMFDSNLETFNERVSYWSGRVSETESIIEKGKLELQNLREKLSSSG